MGPALFLCGNKVAVLETNSTLLDAIETLNNQFGIYTSDVYFTSNGKLVNNATSPLSHNIHANIRCNGGKGGFGSMLRAIGAQIEKTTNREACRDLSGRRLRDINEEKRLKAWLDKQKDREAEAEEKKRKKLEKLMAVPKHDFKDAEYESARSDLTEKVSEAVEEGFKKAMAKGGGGPSTAGVKRKAAEDLAKEKKKKPALWIDDDLSSSTDTSDSDDDDRGSSQNERRHGSSEDSNSNSDKPETSNAPQSTKPDGDKTETTESTGQKLPSKDIAGSNCPTECSENEADKSEDAPQSSSMGAVASG